MGDLQSSVYALLRDPRDAVLNISTSAQLAYIHPTFKPNENTKLGKTFDKLLPLFQRAENICLQLQVILFKFR